MPWTRRWAGASEATVGDNEAAPPRPPEGDRAGAAVGSGRVRSHQGLPSPATASRLRRAEHHPPKTEPPRPGSSVAGAVGDVAQRHPRTARLERIRRALLPPMAARPHLPRVPHRSAKPQPKPSNAAADDRLGVEIAG